MQRYWITVVDEVADEITRRSEAKGTSPSRFLSDLIAQAVLPEQAGVTSDQLRERVNKGLEAMGRDREFHVGDIVAGYPELSRSEKMVCSKLLRSIADDPTSSVRFSRKVASTNLYTLAEAEDE